MVFYRELFNDAAAIDYRLKELIRSGANGIVKQLAKAEKNVGARTFLFRAKPAQDNHPSWLAVNNSANNTPSSQEVLL